MGRCGSGSRKKSAIWRVHANGPVGGERAARRDECDAALVGASRTYWRRAHVIQSSLRDRQTQMQLSIDSVPFCSVFSLRYILSVLHNIIYSAYISLSDARTDILADATHRLPSDAGNACQWHRTGPAESSCHQQSNDLWVSNKSWLVKLCSWQHTNSYGTAQYRLCLLRLKAMQDKYHHGTSC